MKESDIRKTVLLPITIPKGFYCWDHANQICNHFCNKGGSPKCTLNLGNLEYNKNDDFKILKPETCQKLKREAK